MYAITPARITMTGNPVVYTIPNNVRTITFKAVGAAVDFFSQPAQQVWTASTAYTVGQSVFKIISGVYYLFRCTTAGTSGTSEPTWDNRITFTTNDGTAVWTCGPNTAQYFTLAANESITITEPNLNGQGVFFTDAAGTAYVHVLYVTGVAC